MSDSESPNFWQNDFNARRPCLSPQKTTLEYLYDVRCFWKSIVLSTSIRGPIIYRLPRHLIHLEFHPVVCVCSKDNLQKSCVSYQYNSQWYVRLYESPILCQWRTSLLRWQDVSNNYQLSDSWASVPGPTRCVFYYSLSITVRLPALIYKVIITMEITIHGSFD